MNIVTAVLDYGGPRYKYVDFLEQEQIKGGSIIRVMGRNNVTLNAKVVSVKRNASANNEKVNSLGICLETEGNRILRFEERFQKDEAVAPIPETGDRMDRMESQIKNIADDIEKLCDIVKKVVEGRLF